MINNTFQVSVLLGRALELAVPETIRRVFLGHADPIMLVHYDNTQTERIQKQVEDAHIVVLKEFRVEEIVRGLMFKTNILDVPN